MRLARVLPPAIDELIGLHRGVPLSGQCLSDGPRRATPAPAAEAVAVDFNRPPDRLPFLDGIRGLAALYVVHHHVLQAVGWQPDRSGMPAPARLLIGLFTHGHLAVAVFIVLSGYCLMLPVLRGRAAAIPSGGGLPASGLPGGVGGYLWRRARRVLPAYYAALLASLAVAWLVPVSHPWGRDNLTIAQIVPHLLLVHNAVPGAAYGVNGPLWSVATEAQAYLLFPLLLLPAWRRWGAAGAVAVGFAAGIGAYAAAPDVLWRACPWYLGLFALGMTAAGLTHGAARAAAAGPPWGWWAAGLWAVAWAASALRPEWGWHAEAGAPGGGAVAIDAAVGLGTVCLIVWLTRGAAGMVGGGSGSRRGAQRVVQALQWRPVMALGAVSYSLYLTHMPLVLMVAALTRRAGGAFRVEYAVTAGLAVPAAIAVAVVWWRAFEMPFGRRERSPAGLAAAAPATTAPPPALAAFPASLARAA
jgi:peptidoglycan/LPS O-acetylase OafA/YrhL